MIQEYIVAGASKDDFQKRLKAVLVPNTSNPTAPVQSTPQNAAANTTTPPADTSNVSPAANPPAQPDPPAQPQTQDTERRNRESIRAGKRPVETSDESASAAERFKRDLQEWREQQRRLEQQRKEERERIRNQIKQDREERKRREAEENARADSHGVTQASRPSGSSPAKPQQYRLQVRLFDGSSVRTSFPPSATVRGDVRPWLDAQRSDGNRPYTLKHVLTPLPSHTISVAEEERTLEELGLGPTANLVMVPVHAYTEAYASSSSSSLPGRAISAGYNLVSGVVGTVAGLVGSFLEYGPASSDTAVSDNSSQQPVNNTKAPRPAAASSSRGINIRTLRDQREEQDSNQFYNGNQVNHPFFLFFTYFICLLRTNSCGLKKKKKAQFRASKRR